MGASKTVRCLLLLVSVVITAIVVVIATPERIPELKPLGNAAVNSAPAIKISLAGKPAPETPEPQPPVEPETPPEPEPQPEPEPTPQPEVTEPEPQVDATESDTSTEQVSENTAETAETAEEESLSQQVELTAGQSSDVDRYLTELSRHLGRYYEYPRRARRLGQEGAPVVVFEFSRDGTLVDHSLHASSSHALLDDAALDMLKDAEPLPEVPDSMKGQTFTYTLPINFNLR